ncbi:hypothetical protein [Thorsellia kenyensis]|uniref:DUF551 domain-containing protein n=1 Tax=Thorsellia kenyensis TaxID=1549888 RepID=A0ABV6C6K9_9GAMM
MEKFEKWLLSTGENNLCKDDNGKYLLNTVQLALEAWQAGYELAKEEQDSNLTCDQCCNELGMDDGSIRLCCECKGKEKHYETETYNDEKLPPANTPVLARVIGYEDPLLVGYCDEERKWYFHYENEYFDCDTYVQCWCYLPDFSTDNTYKSWTKVRDKQPELNQEVIMCRNGVINAGAFYAKNETAGGFVWIYQSGLKTAVDVNDYWQPLPEPPKED